MKKNTFLQNRNFFIKFLLKNHIYEQFLTALKRHTRENVNLNEIILFDLPETINHSLCWSKTCEGWNFWANVSVALKEKAYNNPMITDKSSEKEIFELKHPEFKRIIISEYAKSRKHKKH